MELRDGTFNPITRYDAESIELYKQGQIFNVVAVSEKDMFNWRNELEVTGTQKILVAFAWCHNDEYRNIQMSPHFLSGDMTFGCNRLKRNIYILNGIDCNNQIFSALHCFQCS